MALTNRYETAVGAGTLTALVLVLVFGSPWYADWARDNTNARTAGGWFLRLLAWPAWRFDSNIFAGAFAALFATLIQSNPSLLGAFQAAGVGAGYGLSVGWVIGIATLGDRRGRG